MAGAVTAVFNCQGPLDAPVFVGSGIVSRKSLSISGMPPSAASEAVMQNKEAGAVAAFDHIPFSHVSANFTFNLDNCVSTNIAKILAILEVEELVIVSLSGCRWLIYMVLELAYWMAEKFEGLVMHGYAQRYYCYAVSYCSSQPYFCV